MWTKFFFFLHRSRKGVVAVSRNMYVKKMKFSGNFFFDGKNYAFEHFIKQSKKVIDIVLRKENSKNIIDIPIIRKWLSVIL